MVLEAWLPCYRLHELIACIVDQSDESLGTPVKTISLVRMNITN